MDNKEDLEWRAVGLRSLSIGLVDYEVSKSAVRTWEYLIVSTRIYSVHSTVHFYSVDPYLVRVKID